MSEIERSRRALLSEAPPLWLLYAWIYAAAAYFVSELLFGLARSIGDDGWRPGYHPIAGLMLLVLHVVTPVAGAWAAAATVRREVPLASFVAGILAAVVAVPSWIVIGVSLQRPLTPRVWGLSGPVVAAAVVPAFRFAAGWTGGRLGRAPDLSRAAMWVAAWLASALGAAGGAATLGAVGGAISYRRGTGGLGLNLDALPGMVVGGFIGGIAGAVLGVAIVQRLWTGRRAPTRAPWMAAAGVVVGIPLWAVLASTTKLDQGVWVLAAVVTGLMAVLGFRWGLRGPSPAE